MTVIETEEVLGLGFCLSGKDTSGQGSSSLILLALPLHLFGSHKCSAAVPQYPVMLVLC